MVRTCAKEEKACQKPASVTAWARVRARGTVYWHICDGAINAEKCIQVLKQHMLLSRWRLFLSEC